MIFPLEKERKLKETSSSRTEGESFVGESFSQQFSFTTGNLGSKALISSFRLIGQSPTNWQMEKNGET